MSEELVAAAMVAYKDNDRINTTSAGLEWLRKPLTRVIDAVEPLIVEEERTRIKAEAASIIDSIGEMVETEGKDWCDGYRDALRNLIEYLERSSGAPEASSAVS